MARYPKSFSCGIDSSYDTIEHLPGNANDGSLVYCTEIGCLCVYDATLATPTWRAVTPILVAGTPGNDSGKDGDWNLAYVGCLAIDTNNGLLYMCTSITTNNSWETVYNQS